jgi:nucleoside-diphosphate-sugar epimerase
MKVLVTGGSGFLGAWVIRRLAISGHEIRVLDSRPDHALVEAVIGETMAAELDWRTGSVAHEADVEAAVQGCDAVVHLAGILVPECAADPVRGATINLIGTLNIFQAARKHGVGRLVYTSSATVYGPDHNRFPCPATHYGAFKLACEGSARAFWHDAGQASIGFRPFVVYGGGREVGVSAGPTLACRAAARGEAYEIPYKAAAGLSYVEDVATACELAILREPSGAFVFNFSGDVVTNNDVVAAIKRVEPGAKLTVGSADLMIVADIGDGDLYEAFPNLIRTPLDEGVRRTVEFYQHSNLDLSRPH